MVIKKKKNFVAIIPARGGSQELKGKNIKKLLGHPLIAYSIVAAQRSKYISQVYVSTDNKKIAFNAKKYGAKKSILIDKVEDLILGQSATGIKNVTANENFFTGHFPNTPIVPGVILIETLAQTAGVVVAKGFEGKEEKSVLEKKIDKLKNLYDYIIIGSGPAASVILNNLIKTNN